MEFFLGLEQFVAQRMLDAQVDRQFDRPLQAIGGKAGAMQIGEAVAVEPFLHPGDALVVDVDQTDQMRDFGAGRIDALVLAQEADAGNAEAVNFLLLLRRDFALQPDEAFLGRTAARGPRRCRDPASVAVRSSIASSLSMIRRGSPNRLGALTSVASTSPLRSTISGRAVAIASCDGRAARAVAVADGRRTSPAGRRSPHRSPQTPGSQIRRGRALSRRGRRCARKAGCGSAAAATVLRAWRCVLSA